MNGKILLIAGVALAACLCAVHLEKSVMLSVSQSPAIQPIQPTFSATAHFQAGISSRSAVQNSTVSSAPEIAAAPANSDDLPTQLEKHLALMEQLREWAAKDFDGAVAYALNMPDGDEKNDALEAVCYGLAQKDPADAVEAAQTLQQPEAVMENLVQQWAANDVSSALVWANEQPAGDQRDQLIQRISFILSQSDPSDAASLVAEQIPPGPAQDEAMMTVVNQWGNQNLAAAASWVKNFPEGPLQQRAVEELEGIEHYKQELARQ